MNINVLHGATDDERNHKVNLAQALRQTPIPDNEVLENLGLYLTRQSLSRINFIQEIYAKILHTHGSIMEFGVRWGQNLALFSSLRGMHEPFNHNRHIIGFDTFQGFPSVDAKDGSRVNQGDYSVTAGWKKELENILAFHEQNSPIPHIRKFELVEGDATVTLPAYLAQHPETVIALAYFDFDIYLPTKVCLEAILPCLTKGSVIAFDELNCAAFPGETLAVKEILGLSRYALRRSISSPLTSYIVIE
jgi:hypothetical protein